MRREVEERFFYLTRRTDSLPPREICDFAGTPGSDRIARLSGTSCVFATIIIRRITVRKPDMIFLEFFNDLCYSMGKELYTKEQNSYIPGILALMRRFLSA